MHKETKLAGNLMEKWVGNLNPGLELVLGYFADGPRSLYFTKHNIRKISAH
jgi:hypothetical protein